MTYDPALQPFNTVITVIQKLLEYANEANILYTKAQIVGIAYNIFLKTGRFKEAITEWNCTVCANQMHNNQIKFLPRPQRVT